MCKQFGIITTHDVYNYGSSLQVYALQTYIEECGLGKVKIIDYKPNYLYKLINFMEVDSEKWRKNWITKTIYRLYLVPFRLSLLKKYIKYKHFNRKYLKLTNKSYTSYEQLREIDCIDNFDTYICGSDQIWNSIKYECGKDAAFYLEFTDKEKVSYAASFGSASISDLGKDMILNNIPKFKAVSVREKSGQQLLSDLSFESTFVLDPVFLLPKDLWFQLSKDRMVNKKYIFVYGYDNSDKYYELIDLVAKRKKIDLIDLNSSKYFKDAGPLEFLDLIKNAELIITTSFHAVAFSIIMNKPFIACTTSNKVLFERIESLLNVSGLQNRKYNGQGNIDSLLENIDFSKVNKNIEEEILKSKEFLDNALR